MNPATPATAARPSAQGLAEEVRYFLTRSPRQLPSRFLYDRLGSALFEAICELPWYSLTRAETRLLERHARDILNPDIGTIVELGSGSGAKLSALIGRAGQQRGFLELHLVDVSGAALAQAGRALEGHRDVRVVNHRAPYEIGLEEFGLARSRTGRRLALFLGSNIGNFDPPGRDTFLRSIRSALVRDDAFLLGVDLVKPERELLLAYDDPLGVTAAFNRNLLVLINRELGGDFDLDGFDHLAIWNEEHSRVEMHLRSKGRQRVAIPGADLELVLEPDETIWTESSYKYRPPEIAVLLERAGFRVRSQWIDTMDRFALTLAESI